MKTIIQKGIAGLGNRFQVLGHCVDLAIERKADLLVDWRDSSFRDNFSDYFSFSSIRVNDFEGGKFGLISPERWAGKVNEKCAKMAFLAGIIQTTQEEEASDWETLVMCRYTAEYSDEIFKHISFAKRICDYSLHFAEINRNYVCYHIRNTDKKGESPDEIFYRIKAESSNETVVVITDSAEVKAMAFLNKIMCPSVIPETPKTGGIHHINDSGLAASGLTKRDINDSAMVDILIGANAKKFYGTCRNSSYSRLINRIRKFNGKEVEK